MARLRPAVRGRIIGARRTEPASAIPVLEAMKVLLTSRVPPCSQPDWLEFGGRSQGPVRRFRSQP